MKHKILVFSIIAVCMITGYLLLNTLQSSPEKSELHLMTKDWSVLSDGVWTRVTLPGTVDCSSGAVELRADGVPVGATGQILTTQAAKYAIEVYDGDRLLYRYNDHEQMRNNTVLSNEICFVPLPDSLSGQQLRIVYHALGQTEIKIPEIRLGSWNATLLYICRVSAYTLGITLTLLILGLLTVVLSVIARYQGGRGKNLRLLNIGLFLLLCGFWCLTDSALIQLLYSYDSFITGLNFYSFMLMPIPLLYYVKNTGEMRRYHSFTIYFIAYYANMAVQTWLFAAGKYTLFQMLWVTHCFFVAGTVLALVLLVREYRRQPSQEIRTCLWSFASAAALGAVSILLYNFAAYRAYQALFQTGVLLFILVFLSVIAEEFMNNLRYRTEAAVYRQMAEEDKLTNLQNRRAFDLRVQGIEQETEHCENVALVFMDVNGLKVTNDLYGHEAGDQLVIAAARCAERAYGQIGYCYRIGGDEFCAIIPDPACTEAELLCRLRRQVEENNADTGTMQPLSLACGCSLLKEPDGTVHTVSDWKAAADSRMYEDKKCAHEKMHLCSDPTQPRGERPL